MRPPRYHKAASKALPQEGLIDDQVSDLFKRDLEFYLDVSRIIDSRLKPKSEFAAKFRIPYETSRGWLRAAEEYELPAGVSTHTLATLAVYAVFNAYAVLEGPHLYTGNILGVFNEAVLREISDRGGKLEATQP